MFLSIKKLLATASMAAVITSVSGILSGTKIEIRLSTKVASDSSKAGESIDAVVIAPVFSGDRIVIPAGSKLHGRVKEVKSTMGKRDERASLVLEFNQLEFISGKKTKLTAKVTDVDNSRESVDNNGRIVGILASETLSSRMDQGLGKLGQKYGGLASVFEAAKNAIVKETQPEIVYPPGTEMTLQFTERLSASGDSEAASAVRPGLGYSESELSTFVNAQPFQTVAEKPPKPSDITNLMFLGSQEQIESAFAAAGWATAAALNSKSGLETFRAIVEERGYKEAPMSVLLLDGQKPDLVFQKQNNTFAKRHHLRIWRRPETFQGKEVWVSSSTHDIGINFSPENRTFIHKIDSQIDRERTKVVNDLVFTGRVKGYALVERPTVPKEGQNATGDKLSTDGKMAVLLFN